MILEKLEGRALEIASEIAVLNKTYTLTTDAMKEKVVRELQELEKNTNTAIETKLKELVLAAGLPAGIMDRNNADYGPPRLDLRYLEKFGAAYVTVEEPTDEEEEAIIGVAAINQ